MSPATSAQVRRRHAARRNALARQQELNAERRRRDEQEIELAADFALSSDECDTHKAAVRAAELAMGRVVDTLIGQLRVRYPRAAQLLDTPEDELRRLRQLALETAQQKAATSSSRPRRGQEPATSAGPAQRAAARPSNQEAAPPALPTTATEPAVAAGK